MIAVQMPIATILMAVLSVHVVMDTVVMVAAVVSLLDQDTKLRNVDGTCRSTVLKKNFIIQIQTNNADQR